MVRFLGCESVLDARSALDSGSRFITFSENFSTQPSFKSSSGELWLVDDAPPTLDLSGSVGGVEFVGRTPGRILSVL